MRISDWSSDVCSSDLVGLGRMLLQPHGRALAACRGVVAGSFGESGHNALRGTQEDVFRGVTASASKAIGATPVNRATIAAGRARPRGRDRMGTRLNHSH